MVAETWPTARALVGRPPKNSSSGAVPQGPEAATAVPWCRSAASIPDDAPGAGSTRRYPARRPSFRCEARVAAPRTVVATVSTSGATRRCAVSERASAPPAGPGGSAALLSAAGAHSSVTVASCVNAHRASARAQGTARERAQHLVGSDHAGARTNGDGSLLGVERVGHGVAGAVDQRNVGQSLRARANRRQPNDGRRQRHSCLDARSCGARRVTEGRVAAWYAEAAHTGAREAVLIAKLGAAHCTRACRHS
jgi:hypothetical protein